MFSAIVFSWFLNLGWVPLQDNVIGNQNTSIEKNRTATVAEVGIETTIDRMFVIGGSVENFQYFNTSVSYLPYRADYKVHFRIKLNEYVSINAEHECDHPVEYVIGDKKQTSYMSTETKIFLRIQGETNVR